MNSFYYQELRRVSDEIRQSQDKNKNEVNKVFETFRQIMRLSIMARREGLFSLEDKISNINRKIETEDFLFSLVGKILDGMDPEEVEEFAMNRIAVLHLEAYDGLILLLYYKAALMIQSNENPIYIEQYIFSMCPRNVINAYEESLKEKGLYKVDHALVELVSVENNIKLEQEFLDIQTICDDGREIDLNDTTISNLFAIILTKLSDRSVQRLLRDIDNGELVLSMMGLPGVAKKRIFDNLSERLAEMLSKDFQAMSPVRMFDVEESCLKIIRIFIELSDSGEISDYNSETIKEVLKEVL